MPSSVSPRRTRLAGLGLGALVMAALLFAPAVHAQANLPVPNAEEKVFVEDGIRLPAYPVEADLIRFPAAGINSVYVDGQALALGKDGVVRYTLVVRSESGAESVSYEGIRCGTGELRIYAYDRKSAAGHSWAPARSDAWINLAEQGPYSRYRRELWRDMLCDGTVPETRSGMLNNLRRGMPLRRAQ